MRVSELCDQADTPLSTIKFYIREGLLPAGERTASNQARYDGSHVERLALIRALRDVCGLGLDPIRRVLAALDDPEGDKGPIRTALLAMEPPSVARSEDEQAEFAAALGEVTAFLDGLDWTLSGRHDEYAEPPGRRPRARAPVDHARDPRRRTRSLRPCRLGPLGSRVPATNPKANASSRGLARTWRSPSRMAILGTLLMEPFLTTMRRYALNARGTRHWESLPVPKTEPIEG